MPQATPLPFSSLLICFAVRQEARFFTILETETGVEMLITGMGQAKAARAVEAKLSHLSPDCVLTCGFAGGLRPGLKVATVLYDEDEPALGPALSSLGAVPGTFHCSSAIAITAYDKARLWSKTGADAVEMESGAIRAICRRRRIPSSTVRVISDSAEQDLPLDFNVLMAADFELNYWKLAWMLCRSPGKVRGLLQLQKTTRIAAEALGRVLHGLVGGKRVGAPG